MRIARLPAFAVSCLLLSTGVSFAGINVVVDHNEDANPDFKFKHVPSPSKNDAASKAKFSVVSGEEDPAGGGLDKLNDGSLPTEEDQPSENFFFNAGTEGGRLLVDLGGAIGIRQVNTYSWHPGARAPQVYTLYASDGAGAGFVARPATGTDPVKAGWQLVARVNTWKKSAEPGGQYGVSISDSDGTIGKYRYLLFDCQRTESEDDFGNTFYSEIDVVSSEAAGAAAATEAMVTGQTFVTNSADGKCEITIDTSRATDLTGWAHTKLAPALAEWYPKIVALLSSEGFTAPAGFSVSIRPHQGVADTGGTRINVSAKWVRDQIDHEAIGSIVHEEVHVVQQYGDVQAPGWLTEGIADYVRWCLYEPQTHGTDLTSQQAIDRAHYNDAYRTTANFLSYVTRNFDKDIVTRINAAIRTGKYKDELWKTYTGKSLRELSDAWKKSLYEKAGLPVPASLSSTNNTPPGA
jgi:hypothetical protein